MTGVKVVVGRLTKEIVTDSGGDTLVCLECSKTIETYLDIERNDVFPYGGKCCLCSKQLAEPQTPDWPDIY